MSYLFSVPPTKVYSLVYTEHDYVYKAKTNMRLIRLLKADLAQESRAWVDKQIISEQQARDICDHYDIDYDQQAQKSFGLNVLSTLGYLFIGLALIVLIGENWQEIPRALRMTGLIGLTLMTQFFAWQQWRQPLTEPRGIGLFFLGNLFYGASLILIAQIYHLGLHMPNGIFYWALGCLPLAVLTRSRLLMLQSLTLAYIWFFLEISQDYIPHAFLLFILASLYVLYVSASSQALWFFTLISVGAYLQLLLSQLWQDSIYLSFHAEHWLVNAAFFIALYGFSQWLSSSAQAKAQDYAATPKTWCLRILLLVMLVMSFEDPWRELISQPWQHLNSALWVSACLCGLAMLFAFFGQALAKTLGLCLFFALNLTLITGVPYFSAVNLQIYANLVLILTGIYLIVQGIRLGISHYFFLGVATVLVLAFCRYIDLIGGYIGAALLFMGSAAILLGAAQFWKHHQRKEHV